MFDAATDFHFVTGANIDAGHSHGDLDRIRLNGVDLMPDRSAVRDPLYGKDIAFLLEAGWERYALTSPSGSPPSFTRKLSVLQLQEICNMFSNTINAGNSEFYWIDPDLSVSETAIANASGYGRLDTLLGAAQWQVPMQTTQFTFVNDLALRRSNVLNIFDTVAAMKRFVDCRGGEILLGTGGLTSNSGRLSMNFGGADDTGASYRSYIEFDAKDVTSNGDGTSNIGGYDKKYDAYWSPSGGSLWQMPTPSCLVGKTKEVWALLYCDISETGRYDPNGSQGRYDGSRSLNYERYWSAYRLVKCQYASGQTIAAGDYLRIVSPDLTSKTSALLSQIDKTRWANMPNPPQGAWYHCRQGIGIYVMAVYPVWEITHTAF